MPADKSISPPPSSKPQRKTQKRSTATPKSPQTERPTIVGLGASAGGLKALQSFFEALPEGTGMAFVVITHLHPEHESHMAELLQTRTRMLVQQVNGNITIEPDHVYVVPPNQQIIVTDYYLQLEGFEEKRGQRTPIDHFFRSLAHAHRESVAIILSGGGTDGAVGIKAIKEAGGLLMVQDPEEAEYDSMPRAAIDTGLADVVLGVRDLAQKLVGYTRQIPNLPQDAAELTAPEMETVLRILAQVHARTGHDFSQYKRATILRRIQRRMQLHGHSNLDQYMEFLRHNSTEAFAIFNDILIGVTNFFRDRESWEAMAEQIVPKIFEGKEVGDTIRVWSIGCATGEEAYSLAMLLIEHAETQHAHYQIQVFASDLDDKSLARAREGLYPAVIEVDVSPERLERFFLPQGNYYQVRRELREAVVFTRHSVLRDPPFSRLDLVTCRNLLIYLQREMQEHVFDIYHYALKPGGYLFLGSSESAEAVPELFDVIDKTHRIYQAKPWQAAHPHIPALPLTIRRSPDDDHQVTSMGSVPRHHADIASLDEKHQKTLEAYGPPSILVNEEYNILHLSETAGRYLMQPRGPITSDLIKLVRPELQLKLRYALVQAFKSQKSFLSEPITVRFDGTSRRVLLFVHPRGKPDQNNGGSREIQALVAFLEDELREPAEEPGENVASRDQARSNALVVQLESEVQHLREQLQATVEKYHSSNEEMKAANEELQSINEEFRSATEELETSKEELQSVNEELQTVNNELKNKLDEISRAQSDLENLMGATEIGMLFLDRELKIQRFTSGINNVLNVLSSDRGRPISHLTHKLAYTELVQDAEQVLKQLIPMEREVQGEDGKWYLVRHRLYRTVEDKIEGVVITFINITELRAQEQMNETLEGQVRSRTQQLRVINDRLSQANVLFDTLFHANPIPTTLMRAADSVFMNVNDSFLKSYGFKREEILGRTPDEINFRLTLTPKQESALRTRLQRERQVRDFEVGVILPSAERKTILASMQRITVDQTQATLTAFVDITERVQAEQQIRMLAATLTSAEQEERRRISQILHDDLQQRLFAVKMQMSMLYDAFARNDLHSAEVDFAQLQEWLSESISITRNLSIDLSPAILQGEGLTDALIWLSNQMGGQYGLQVTLQTNDIPTRFEDTLRILLFHAVREALFNIVKHANSLYAIIHVEQIDGHIRLTISDDGKGFDADGTSGEPKPMRGLLNIRHRLALMGCSLRIKSLPGKGTQVIIEIPPQEVNR